MRPRYKSTACSDFDPGLVEYLIQTNHTARYQHLALNGQTSSPCQSNPQQQHHSYPVKSRFAAVPPTKSHRLLGRVEIHLVFCHNAWEVP